MNSDSKEKILKKLDCSLVERVSKKSGNTYQALVIKLTDTYEKLVMIEQSEQEILRLSLSSK